MAALQKLTAGAPKLGHRALTAVADRPDLRDRTYEPHLEQLPLKLDPPAGLVILDQQQEGACTGFAMAAVVNKLNQLRYGAHTISRKEDGASARMLYEMARFNDEWEGEDYDGSSIRGVVRGFFHNGVCTWRQWPYVQGRPGGLTVKRARAARSLSLGAYYRVMPVLNEYHAAISESGAVICSAQIHAGWQNPAYDRIEPHAQVIGGHAFALVGYDDRGFWVQNSWGSDWGRGGLALWLYEDWIENVMDAWVLRLAIPVPQVFGRVPAVAVAGSEGRISEPDSPRRSEIAGHYVHLDDGGFHEGGKFWSNADDVEETADRLFHGEGRGKYKHLLFYAHGGLNSVSASANRIRWMRDVFKDNGIYPYHFMWDTGLLEELKDVLFGRADEARERVGGITDFTDKMLEVLAGPLGTAVWNEMKRGAERSFIHTGDGLKAVRILMKARSTAAPAHRLKVHVIAHSAGSILIGHLLKNIERLGAHRPNFETINLMAPACTNELYEDEYRPRIGAGPGKVRALNNLCLSEQREEDDSVALVYRKSLLWLVSNAFEERKKMPLLGMQVYNRNLPPKAGVNFFYAGAGAANTDSKGHEGFDNDAATMNGLLQTIMGADPVLRPFTDNELKQY